MRAIRKGREPVSLTQYRSTPNATYADYQNKDALRQSLATEQRGLCCYCLSRIHPNREKMKIEHWHCQASYPAEQLVYTNLLGACHGHANQPRARQHCDAFKGDSYLSRNPADPEHQIEDTIHYLSDGTVQSDDAILKGEIENVLNLNCALLKNNRKAVLDGLIDTLPKRGNLPDTTWERLLRDWDGESTTGNLREFCQVVVYWLRKRLRRN